MKYLALLLLLAGCTVPQPDATTPRPVAAVDLPRYLGTWHEAARLPNTFQDSARLRCVNTTATYVARPDARVDVWNACDNALEPGTERRQARGLAYAVPGAEGARLRVSFFWPFHGDYWVIGLDPDYRWAVVGAPGRDYLWILSRTTPMATADYAAAVAIAQREGFDVTRLQRDPP